MGEQHWIAALRAADSFITNVGFRAEHDLILLNNFDKNICIELIYDSLLYIVNLFTYAL